MKNDAKPGWHSRGYLPHFDANTLVQHVIFRTRGALPDHLVHPRPDELLIDRVKRIDAALDDSREGQIFASPKNANIMQEVLKFFDGRRYDLQAWCIMPNHVHVVLVVRHDILLGEIVRSWKRSVTWQINREQHSVGSIFAKDYYDRYVRNLKHGETIIHYVEANPIKAGLCSNPDDWLWSSAFARAQGWKPCQDHLPLFLS
jgi:REP element-mobilizing transposase RayT